MTSDVSPRSPGTHRATLPLRKKTAERENDVPSSDGWVWVLDEGVSSSSRALTRVDGSSKLSSMHAGSCSTHTNSIEQSCARARQSQGSTTTTTTTWNLHGKLRHRGLWWRNKSLPKELCGRGGARFSVFAITGRDGGEAGGGKAFRGNLLIRCHGDRTGHHIKSCTTRPSRRLWLLLLHGR